MLTSEKDGASPYAELRQHLQNKDAQHARGLRRILRTENDKWGKVTKEVASLGW